MQATTIVWIGRIISILCILFLVVDAGMKIVKAKTSIEATVQLGWPVDLMQAIGIICLLCTLLYAIPKTAVIGAIALSTYLGGAVAIMVRSNTAYWFPILFGIFVWVGLLLRNEAVRKLVIQ